LTLLAGEIGLDRVIQEESVLIEVILGLDLGHTHGLCEGLSGWLSNSKSRKISYIWKIRFEERLVWQP